MSSTILVNTQRRDWFRILRDLMKAGVSYAEVARKCNRNPTTVQGWADGGDPKDTDARIVLALYALHCPKQYAEHQAQFDIRVMKMRAPKLEPEIAAVQLRLEI